MAWDLKAQRSTHIRGCRKQRAAVDLSLWAFVAAPVLQRCLATRNPMSLEIPDNFDATLGGSSAKDSVEAPEQKRPRLAEE